ncbi:hypothetical protein [Amycolatopsis sp. cmx-4-61]|uniref:hypothetical protein n=1 Tax=Amycolatopsis sp. cmx-4-61 TaxID=2790937 RepID=UPI00397A806C
MNLAELTPERRRDFAAHLASESYAPDGLMQVELSRTETVALANLLELLAARPADDPTGAEGILNDTAKRLTAQLRERVAAIQR